MRCRMTSIPSMRLPWIVEVLSPSNTAAKVNRQRIVALSAGTEEFWVVDAENKIVQVTNAAGTRDYQPGDQLTVDVIGGGTISIDQLFG
jgi:Uma2 family endonuclease